MFKQQKVADAHSDAFNSSCHYPKKQSWLTGDGKMQQPNHPGAVSCTPDGRPGEQRLFIHRNALSYEL